MKKVFKIAILILIFVAFVAVIAHFLGGQSIDVLEPSGMIGAKEKDIIVTASLLMMIVVVPVFILTLIFAWVYRESNGKAKHTPDWEHNSIAEYCWWGIPVLIIAVLAVITWRSCHELNPFRPITSDKKPLNIQVVALQWKWLFLYPEQGIASLNYVEFPEKTPIHFEITSDAPMNSFWIPKLGGQIYCMPAMRSELNLIADETGSFRGCSANISGDGFAGMRFIAKASTEEEFDGWVAQVKGSKKLLNWTDYEEMVKPSSYVPPEYFMLTQEDLFEKVLMKYMAH